MTTRSKYATNFKHGESGTELYQRWAQMNGRCYLPSYINYPKYGGKGIGVCDEWRRDFICFRDWALANGWKARLSLDRKDNSLGYSPSNCRWVTVPEQQRNKRGCGKYRLRDGVGVGKQKDGRWRAWISVKNSTTTLGRFNTKEEAIKARAIAVDAVANGHT